jgi:hypothetical protein
MPRVPTDYSKTCIYKLVHKDDVNNENVYIGSTTNFRKRKNEHKSRILKEGNEHYFQKKYVYIRENGGWDSWEMIEIEKYPCNDKREAETRERYWIEQYKSELNSSVPTRNLHEWYLDNKETHSANAKIYRERNKDSINKQRKQYYETNKEQITQKIKEYKQKNKEFFINYQKKYQEENNVKLREYRKNYYNENKLNFSEKQKTSYIQNKDKILKKVTEYRQNNKEKIQAYQQQKTICECGCEVRKLGMLKHRKTAKHIKLMEQLNIPP